jgi:hypothetical protein
MTTNGATERQPWTGEALTLPTRWQGRRILAAIKLPTGTGPQAWALVVELPGDMFASARLTVSRSGQRSISFGTPVYSYPEAVEEMMSIYARGWRAAS